MDTPTLSVFLILASSTLTNCSSTVIRIFSATAMALLIRPEKTLQIYSELHETIQDKFNEAGIEIASPHFAAICDGNAMSVPEEYLPKDYRYGGFNLVAKLRKTPYSMYKKTRLFQLVRADFDIGTTLPD